MKVALIIPNNVWFCPYVSIYTNILKQEGVDYDIISWNRDGKKEDAIQFDCKSKHSNPFSLLFAYIKFASFVKKVVNKNKYDNLIVFTPQSAIFLSSFLKTKYKGKYIFDYRDLSIEQKIYFKRPFITVLKNSFANVISSPGFKEYLPKGFEYLLSHNFNIEEVRKCISDRSIIVASPKIIDVLTIGGIRDYESNVQIINNLANIDGFTVRFVGKGPSAHDLEQYSKKINAQNISFEGYYPKEKEKDYVSKATFINIFYPRRKSHDSALSNRFYNSLLYRKPMITTKDTIQGNYTEKYRVGVALDDKCNNLAITLKNYLNNLDIAEYNRNCTALLEEFSEDYNKWERMLIKFIE